MSFTDETAVQLVDWAIAGEAATEIKRDASNSETDSFLVGPESKARRLKNRFLMGFRISDTVSKAK
jgi:hypothetical protein